MVSPDFVKGIDKQTGLSDNGGKEPINSVILLSNAGHKMKRKQFWEVFYKRDTYEFEVMGPSFDDTILTNRTCEMMKAGCFVNCSTVPYEGHSRESIIKDMANKGYRHVVGLFDDTYIHMEKQNKPDASIG